MLILLLNPFFRGFAQEEPITVTGQVISGDDQQPLPGVTVKVKGVTKGTTTDFDGNYELRIEPEQSLVFSYVGFKAVEIPVNGRTIVNVILQQDLQELDETVVVGFGTQKKASLVSSVTTINPKELKGPTSNLTTMMAGRVSGMIAYQRSGEPGADNSDFFIRGLGSFGSGKVNPLILIDGIESSTTDMARLQPDDIDSFSVLKDAAAAAIYGARGANGVVLITTKSGEAGKVRFKFRAENRISSNTRNFRFADNITYMNLANEAALTRDPNSVLPYTQTKIDRTAAGDDPLLYPNNNWIDQLIKDYTVNQGYNLSAAGGGERARYYVAGTYNVDNGVLKVDNINNFNSNIKLRNYSIRSNVDVTLTGTTEAAVRLYGQFDDYNGPAGGGGATFSRAIWSNPVKFPAVYPSGLLPYVEHPLFGGAVAGQDGTGLLTNPYAEMVRGYQVWKRSNIQAQLELKQDLNSITEGLSARAMGYVKRMSYFQVSRQYNPFYYSSSLNPIDNSINLRVLNDGGANSIGTPGSEYLGYDEGDKEIDSRIYLETAINYNRIFGEKHAVSGMLINIISSYETGNSGDLQSSLAHRNHGISGRFTYSYDDRYLTEFNFGYNGSERFAQNHRYGFFPSFGIGYRISNEKFFEPLKKVVNNLKLRATYGWVGNDAIGDDEDRFFYLSDVNLNNALYGASFGETFNYYRPGVSISRYANTLISWEKSEQINIGMDINMFNNSLEIIVDAFRQRRSNILQQRSNLGSTMGLMVIPSANFGKAESQGVDVSLNYNKQLSQNWWTSLRGNLTYATSKIIKFDENIYPENMQYRYRKGQSISRQFGFIAERLFVDDEEVANSPSQFGTYMGGDIKYRDMNGDGMITANDMVPIGYPTTPEIVYGFGGTVGFKDFDFSAFFQGVARTSFFIHSGNISPFVLNYDNDTNTYAQNGLLGVIADSHWSEENRDVYAFWPRLSDTFIENNNRTSTWWMRNGAFLRLKNVEIGYNAPGKLLDKYGIKGFRVYLSGTNLALWSKFKMWDPEMGGSGLGYPIQSVYNLGILLDL
ncbi:SusC/RagA family TonB-linked outer membrane protein [Sinomicrobium sp. M5D2P9]